MPIETPEEKIDRLYNEREKAHSKLARLLQFAKNMGQYVAVEWNDGDGSRYALSFQGTLDPVVSLNPKYDAMEAFEDFAKWLKEESERVLRDVDELEKNDIKQAV